MPSRHKLALLTMVGAYPTMVLLLAMIGPVMGDTPMPLKAAVLVPLMVVMLTYFVMPLLTRLFQGWLHGNNKTPAGVISAVFAMLLIPTDLVLAQNSTIASKHRTSHSALDGMTVDHVMVNVSDFERSVKWYEDKLGFKETVRWTVEGLPGTNLAYLKRGSFLLEVASGPTTDATSSLPRAKDFNSHFAQRGITHLCFKVRDVDAALAELNDNGVPTFSPAIDFPALNTRVGFIQDPDGNVIEFKGPMAGNSVVNGKATWANSKGAQSKSPETVIREKLNRWRGLWSQTGKGRRFSVDGYRDLFVSGELAPKMLTFDAYVPDWASTQIDGFDDYRRIWNKDVNESFPNWTITRMDVLRVEVADSGDMAWSALNFWGEGTRDGERYEGSQHGTHVWTRVDGDWRILHEHLTAPITVRGVTNAKIESSKDTEPHVEAVKKVSESKVIRELSRQWIEEGFSPGESTKSFRFEDALAKFYSLERGSVVLHDSNDPEMRVVKDATTYGAIWEKLFAVNKSVTNELTEFHQVLITGDLAITSFTADAIVTTSNSETFRIPILYSLGWRKISGHWKIVHEHGSSLKKDGFESPVGD